MEITDNQIRLAIIDIETLISNGKDEIDNIPLAKMYLHQASAKLSQMKDFNLLRSVDMPRLKFKVIDLQDRIKMTQRSANQLSR